MKVGDLVRCRYRKQDLGIIIETVPAWAGIGIEPTQEHKVMWTATYTGWMRASGLEVVSENR